MKNLDRDKRDALGAIVDNFKSQQRQQVSLDELAVCAEDNRLDHGAIEALIDALEAVGITVGEADPPGPTQDEAQEILVKVLAAARSLKAELGRAPSTAEIAERLGLEATIIRRVLRFGATLT